MNHVLNLKSSCAELKLTAHNKQTDNNSDPLHMFHCDDSLQN